ncbi:hypothetical protein [Bacillus sp. B1-b2]|uniref:hypothetical protein n=1 Tax=Bacillus sp. B1-b2 TaxID=2653201 RepID=UPI00126153CF|nr:hypothetical protein [Bacillus sp. B1-b2]KAB7668926.1 hypothetical protein F9279_12030 [Bacillus sp. B1-b2]
MNTQKVEEIYFSSLKEIASNGEGLVMLGCGGDLSQWINGVSEEFRSAGVTTTNDPKTLWGNIYKATTKDQRIDLIFVFNEDFKELFDVSKLAMWRISWGGASWLSDYVRNFVSDFEDNDMSGGELDVHIG